MNNLRNDIDDNDHGDFLCNKSDISMVLSKGDKRSGGG